MSFEANKPHLYDYAIVDNATGDVVNVVVWDGEPTGWTPPDGTTMVALPYTEETDDEGGVTDRRYTGGIGWTYRDNEFVDERPVEDLDV